MTAENSGKNQRGKPFAKGQSGNPKGKPPGTRNAALVALDKIGADAATDILKKVVESAKGGNLGASEIILSRAWPVRKGRPVSVALPEIKSAADVNNALASVVAAMGAGKITPDEATAISGVIEAQRRAIETVELDRRLAEIENKLGIGGQK